MLYSYGYRLQRPLAVIKAGLFPLCPGKHYQCSEGQRGCQDLSDYGSYLNHLMYPPMNSVSRSTVVAINMIVPRCGGRNLPNASFCTGLR